jgi:hypothetical protein
MSRMKSNSLDDLITQAEAARLRGVTPVAIADLIKRGRLTPVEIAGRRHLSRSEVLDFREKPAGRPARKVGKKGRQGSS